MNAPAPSYDVSMGNEVLRQWDDLGITSEIYDGYFQYHQESVENAFADIESLATTSEHAW